MNENINLCEILKGHEGKTFYSPIFGSVTFEGGYPNPRFRTATNMSFVACPNGKFTLKENKLYVFPSEDQRDWNKWDKENNPKVPKTWSGLVKVDKATRKIAQIYSEYGRVVDIVGSTPIEKAALALLKINQLIEVEYGGNVTDKEDYYEDWTIDRYSFIPVKNDFGVRHICFHTKEQAEEFLKYPENIQLLKDYFMI